MKESVLASDNSSKWVQLLNSATTNLSLATGWLVIALLGIVMLFTKPVVGLGSLALLGAAMVLHGRNPKLSKTLAVIAFAQIFWAFLWIANRNGS